MSMAAHPADLMRWVSNYQAKVRHVLRNHRTRANESIAAYSDTANNRRVRANRTAALQHRSFVQGVSVYLRARIGDIRENTRRPQKHIVFDNNAGIDSHVVLYFNVVTNQRSAVHIDVLAYDAAVANFRTLHHMCE